MIEIQSPRQLAALRPLFAGQPTVFFLDAMIAGNCSFRAWCDGDSSHRTLCDGKNAASAAVQVEPHAALLWDTHSLFFPIGDPVTPGFQEDLAYLFTEIILPSTDARGQDAFLFHTSSDEWDARMSALLPGFTLARYPRVIFEQVQPPPADWRDRIPSGFEVRLIDRKLLALTSIEGMEGLVAEIEECWPSRKHFLEAGFGAAVLEGRRIACRITAEYAAPGHIGIGILTEERYRGRGLAPLATFAFLEQCARRGLSPHWDAWKNNQPSVRAAEKAGFTHPLEYSALLAYRGQPG